MRLTVLKEQGSWQLSEMEEVHLNLLRMAAEDASMTDCPEGRDRLFPSPISGESAKQEKDFLEDWKEYVQEEMETQFAQDVGIMLADLDAVELQDSSDEELDDDLYHVTVPLDHVNSWFSTLNQARLMLDARYRLHPDDELLQFEMIEDLVEDDELRDRLEAFMRYEFYALIQEWLVQQVMMAGDSPDEEEGEADSDSGEGDII